MAIASSTSGVQGPSQTALQQFRVQQAQRNAAQAEQTAQALRAAADAAQRDAVRADERARALDVDATQAQGRASEARQGLAILKSLAQSGSRLIDGYGRAIETQTRPGGRPQPAASPVQRAEPVVNARGQITGKVINVAA